MPPWWRNAASKLRRLSGKGNDKPLEAAVQLQEEATEQGRQSCAGTDDVGCNMVVAGGAESKTTINVDTKCTPTSLNPDEQLSSDMGDFVQTTVTQAYPFGHLQLGLLSEPTSLASTNLHSHVSQDPGLFSRKPPQEELLPRVMGGVETISEMDITVGAADKKMEAAATRYSMRPAEDVLIPEPIAEKPAIKLTAATLGTHVALTDGVRSVQRTSRKNNFIKSWLMDAELVADAASGAPAPNSISPSSPSPQSSQPQHAGLSGVEDALLHADSGPPRTAAPLAAAQLQYRQKVSSSQMCALLDAAAAAGTLAASNHTVDHAGAGPGPGTGTTQHAPPASGSSGLTSPVAASLTRVGAPTEPSALTLPFPQARLLRTPASPAASAFDSAAGGRVQPPVVQPIRLPMQPATQHAAGASQRPFSASLAMEVQALHAPAPRPLSKQPSIPEHHLSDVTVMAGDAVSMYIPSTVTTMTTTSTQADARESIPARMVDNSSSHGPSKEPRAFRVGGDAGGVATAAAAAMRLPQAAPQERTKTIAVASHCPEDMYAQAWSIDDFVLLRKLYEGALSVVCHAQHKRSGRHVALKVYKRSRLHEMERFQLAREICLHIRILHPYILALFAAWKDSKYVYLALEWAPRGNLFDFLVSRGGRLEEPEAAAVVIRPLMAAAAFLHAQNFIHRDIKLENIVLDAQCQIKLCDFGLAIDQKFEQANTRLGTFGYFAPELLNCPLKKGPFDFKGDPSVPTYDCKVDCWSAGVLAYELLTGKAPFSASTAPKILEAIKTRELEYPAHLSEGAVSFLKAALARNPAQRATAKQLMTHPWVVAACAAFQGGSPLPAFASVPPAPAPAAAGPPVVQAAAGGAAAEPPAAAATSAGEPTAGAAGDMGEITSAQET